MRCSPVHKEGRSTGMIFDSDNTGSAQRITGFQVDPLSENVPRWGKSADVQLNSTGEARIPFSPDMVCRSMPQTGDKPRFADFAPLLHAALPCGGGRRSKFPNARASGDQGYVQHYPATKLNFL